MSEVINFRLDPNNPRETQALGVLASFQERGYSARHILTEALLKFDHAGIEHELQAQMAEILAAMNKVGDQIERLQRTGVSRTEPRDEKQAALAETFVLSVKSAVKPGITLES